MTLTSLPGKSGFAPHKPSKCSDDCCYSCLMLQSMQAVLQASRWQVWSRNKKRGHLCLQALYVDPAGDKPNFSMHKMQRSGPTSAQPRLTLTVLSGDIVLPHHCSERSIKSKAILNLKTRLKSSQCLAVTMCCCISAKKASSNHKPY